MLKTVATTLTFLALIPTANAQVFTCEENGRKIYQGTPCAPGDQPIKVRAPKQPTAEPPLEAVPPETTNTAEPQALEKKLWTHARRGQVAIGMTTEMVVHAWGEPDKVSRLTLTSGTGEQWVYDKNRASPQYISFKDGTVSAFSE